MKKARKCQHVHKGQITDYDDKSHKSQQIQYAYIQTLEEQQKENSIGEKEQSNEVRNTTFLTGYKRDEK